MEEREYNEHGIGDMSDSLVESQSTQLLDFVLGRAEPEWNNNNAPVMNEGTPSSEKHSTTTTSSAGEVVLSVGGVAPYHLHGLADTQSESQYIGSGESQKENDQSPCSLPPSAPQVGASKSLSSVNPSPTTRLKPSRALTTNALEPLSVLLPSQPDDANRIPNANTKTSSRPLSVRQAPLLQKPYSKPPAMRFRRRPSPISYSQDSFAGPTASQDPDLFLARSRQFEIPLDQLGLSNSQEESPPQAQTEENSGESTSDLNPEERRHREEDQYSMTSYTSTSIGTVLVANSDSSGPSQDVNSQRIIVGVSISQEPTQILGDLSDRSSNFSDPNYASDDREKEPEEPTQILGEDTQPLEQTQEATQLLEGDSTGLGEPSNSHGTSSLLSLIAPEKRYKYIHHAEEKSEATSETSQMPSGGLPTTIGSHSGQSRSLLSTIAPEKHSRYLHHYKGRGGGGSVTVSEASRMATFGTSLGSGSGGAASRETQPQPQEAVPEEEEEEAKEEVAQDSIIMQSSAAQVELGLSLVRPGQIRIQNREQVIPPSESEAPDCSKEEEEEEEEEGEDVDEVEELANKPPSAASVKGKERATVSPRAMSPRKGRLVSTKGVKSSATTAPAKTSADSPSKRTSVVNLNSNVPVDVFPTPEKSPITRSKAADIDTAPIPSEDVEVSPLSDLPQSSLRRGRGKPRGSKISKGKPNKQDLVGVSAKKVSRRELRSTTPALLPEVGEEGEDQESPEIPLARLAAARRADREIEEEEETEIADDEEIDDEADERSIIGEGPSTRKRKRGNTAASRRGEKTKATARKVTTRATSVAQAQPPLKKTKTETGTFENVAVAAVFGAGLGTQVFALFKSDSSFYGAEVQSLSGTRAHVKFFDELDEPNIGVEQMRRFELRTGDVVIPGQGTQKAKVIDDRRWASDNEVDAVYVEGPNEGVQVVLRAPDIRIPARIIQSQWENRTLDASKIIPAIVRKTLRDTPSPSKGSLLSIQPTRNARNKLLSKYGIVISLGPGNGKWVATKEKYTSIVKENGGTVLPNWLDLFSLQGKHCNGNKRWTLQRTDVKYAPRDKGTFDRVFLVADAFNQKPSYLLALALGIPCVSLEWLDYYASGKEMSWARFLLAAGHSEPLGAAVSQMVDLDWGTASEHLTDIMENRVPQKVLSKASVLCLGAELLPFPNRKTTDTDRASAPSRIVPRIVLAMGAEYVEAVSDARYASKGLDEFDYVVVKDSKALPVPYVDGATYVDITWVKECLIAGRLLPVPDSE